MDLVRVYEEVEETLEMSDVEIETPFTTPGKRYMRNAKAMSATPADVKEYPDKYVFVLDMPGVKATDIRVTVGENRVLHVNAKRKREEDEEDEKEKESTTSSNANVKYLSMERRMGKFMKRFALPDNANTDSISAVYKDGVLSVTVEKKPPLEPKKSKLIQVKVA